MKEESLIPEALRGAFKDFASLKSDQEKEVFWIELAKNLKGTSPEHSATFKRGLAKGSLTNNLYILTCPFVLFLRYKI